MSDIRDFRLPDLGEGLEEGEIVEWHVEVGDTIELNQTVADVETAKAVVAVPSPFAGVVVERIGEIGEALEVGSVFVRIDVSEGAVAVDAAPAHQGEASPAQGGFEADPSAAAASAPDPGASPTAAIADDEGPADAGRASTGLDADEEPQPLVGYGQGRSGPARGRRRRGAGGGGGAGGGDAANGDAAGAEAKADASSGRAPAAVLAKPPVRKLAKDLKVDLGAVAPGSGPDGVITRDDVQRAAASASERDAAAGAGSGVGAAALAPAVVSGSESTTPAPPPELRGGAGEKAVPGFRGRLPGEVEPIRGIRKRIVEKMELSRREIPEASCSREADLTELWEVRKALTVMARDEGFDVKITPFSLVMRAAVLGLRRFPTLNARIDRDAGEIHLLEHINLGFAADTDRGLMVPNIKDAHTKSTLQLALELTTLAGQARDGSIGPGPLTGGTFTVNNYGAFGNDDGDPIINHPEAAILGIGAIRERPWVVPARSGNPDEPGELAVRRVARFTLAFDHRICDGGEAGRFVTYVADLCEQPAKLLLHV